MAFTLGAIAAKDGAGSTIGGGLLAADIAGSGVGPWIIYHGLVDGVAGVNRLNITAANAMKVDGSAATQPVSGTFWQATQPVSGPLTDAQLRATAVPISGTVTVNALPAGTSNIGDVDVLSVPADPFGANADAASSTGSLSAKLRFIAATGIPVTALPALPAGSNVIGGVNIAAAQTLATVTTVGTLTGGGVASGATDSGNPLKIGGVFNTAQPTVTNGQRVDAQFSARGAMIVTHGVDGIAVGGAVAHDGVDANSPNKIGGYASAAAPANVSADGDRTNAWFLRNGALAVNVSAAGALIGGDATNGLDVDVTRINGVAPAFGSGAAGATVLRVLSATDDPIVTALNSAASTELPAGDEMIGYVNGSEYEAVAASQTAQILGATGAVGDYLSHLLVVPATTGAGNISIIDGNGSNISVFVTGTLSNLVPFSIPVGAKCVNGTTPGWKVTTGANVSVVAFGNFT